MKTIVASLLLCFGSLAFLLPKDDENLVQDKGFYDEKIVVKRINDERLEFAKKFNVTQMFELQIDESLTILAEEAVEICDSGTINASEYKKIRFNILHTHPLSADIRTAKENLKFDLFNKTLMNQFEKHLQKNGTDLSKAPEKFQYLYNVFQSDQSRIGCTFKVCTYDDDYKLFNQLCFLGPQFGAQSWTEKAALLAKSCNIPETPLIEAHHATFYKSPLVPLKLFKPGEVMAKEYLRLTEDEVKNEYYKFIPYFWNHTFIGCALMKEECHEQLLICNVEKSEFELGKAFEEGNQCSKCGRVKCDQGLCDGVPPGKGLMKKSTLMPYYSFIIFIVFLIIFQ
uniref:SCP domain-containing protein n=2 Tax=Caenorhabditis japonica TaxID=281687 RepID=A0A8R1ILP6_CAEJA